MTTLNSVAKIFAITSSILLLSSCTQYRYDVTYEKCNGQTGALSYIAESKIITRDFNIRPAKYGTGLFYAEGKISNVCDFSYTRNPIK